MTVKIQAPFQVDGYFKSLIEEKAQRFNFLLNKVTTVSFFIREEEKRHFHSEGKKVEIQCNVPGTELFSSGTAMTFEVALSDAYEKMKTQLKRYKEKAA
jgi:ribosomal subunit interface protein